MSVRENSILALTPSKKSLGNTSTITSSDFNSLTRNYTSYTDNLAETEQDKRYLELLGVSQINKSFQSTIDLYDTQLKEQYKQSHLESDVAYEKSINLSAENSKVLGTGSKIILSDTLEKNKQQTDTAVDKALLETKQTFLDSLDTEYVKTLTQYLGGVDSETGKFNKLLDYQQMSEDVQDKLFEYMATTLLKNTFGTKFDTLAKTNYMKTLANQGIIAQNENGDYEITETTTKYFDLMLNSLSKDSTGNTVESAFIVTDQIADQLARDALGEKYDDYTPEEKYKAKEKYLDWMDENMDTMKHTNLGFSIDDDDKFVSSVETIDNNNTYDDVKALEGVKYISDYYGYQTGEVYDFSKTSVNDSVFGKSDLKNKELVDSIVSQLTNAEDQNAVKGTLVYFKLGANDTENSSKYMYTGNGTFVKVTTNARVTFLPEGYKFNWLGEIRKK